MSRAYRIRIRQSESRTVRGRDEVSTQLEVLPVLPPEQMAGLLRQQLLGRGFEEQGPNLVRRQGGITVTVEPQTGAVTVQSEACQEVKLEVEVEGQSWDDDGMHAHRVREELKAAAKKKLDSQADQQASAQQNRATEQLEARLGDVSRELNQAVNRATAEALKVKAAQLGRIKEMSEDPQAGSLTIVVEV